MASANRKIYLNRPRVYFEIVIRNVLLGVVIFAYTATTYFFTRFKRKPWVDLKNFVVLLRDRESWRGKMGIGIGRFCPRKMGFKPLGLGFGHWEWEKNVKNQKWEWDLRIAKWDLVNELRNGIGTLSPLRTLSSSTTPRLTTSFTRLVWVEFIKSDKSSVYLFFLGRKTIPSDFFSFSESLLHLNHTQLVYA